MSKVYLGSTVRAQLYLLAETPQPPPPRIWAYIRGCYWSAKRMRSSLLRMRSSLVVRASDCQCTSCNGPGFDPSIRRHSGIWGAADEAVLNIVRKKKIDDVSDLLNFSIVLDRRWTNEHTSRISCRIRKLQWHVTRWALTKFLGHFHSNAFPSRILDLCCLLAITFVGLCGLLDMQ